MSGVECQNFSSRARWCGFDPQDGYSDENFLFCFRVEPQTLQLVHRVLMEKISRQKWPFPHSMEK